MKTCNKELLMGQVQLINRPRYDLRNPVSHNGAPVEALPGGGLAIAPPRQAWAYGAAFIARPVDPGENGQPSQDGTDVRILCVTISVGVIEGRVSLLLLSRDKS